MPGSSNCSSSYRLSYPLLLCVAQVHSCYMRSRACHRAILHWSACTCTVSPSLLVMYPLALSLSHLDSSSQTSDALSPATHRATNLGLRRRRSAVGTQTLSAVTACVPGMPNLLLLKLSYLARNVDANRAEQLLSSGLVFGREGETWKKTRNLWQDLHKA